MDIIDLDFYRRFRVVLPLNPETISKRLSLVHFAAPLTKKPYAFKNRQKKKETPSEKKASKQKTGYVFCLEE